jgi:hypothetical protein
MAALPPRPSGGGKAIPGAYYSLIAVSFSELRRDMIHLVESRWAEPVRRRADELASTLADACERQGLVDVARAARSLANLARLPRREAAPVLSALREKSEALLREAQKFLLAHSERSTG